MSGEWVQLDVEVKVVTAKAVLVTVDDDADLWIPLSCVVLDETDVKLQRGATGTMTVEMWFAKKEGIA